MRLRKILKPLIEILIVNFILYLFFYRLQSNPEIYFQLNPHPLLIFIIGFALAYGNFIGLMTSFVTCLIYLYIMYLTYSDFGTKILSFEYFKYPLVFLWVSTIIGTIIDNYREDYNKLEDDYELSLDKLKTVQENYELSTKALNQLQKQIITSDESIISLYNIAKKLKQLNKEGIYNELIGILAKYLHADVISLYKFDKKSGYFRLKIQKGISKIENSKSINIMDRPEYLPVVKESKVLKFSDVEKENFPLLVGPLIKNNETVGMVMIERMSFDHISNYAYVLFKVILDWVALSLEHADIFEKQVHDKYYDDTSIMKYEYFKEYMKVEDRRKKEYDIDYVIFSYKIPEEEIFSKAMKLKSVIRDLDVVSIHNDILYLLLPAMDLEIKSFVIEKIYSRLDFNLKVLEIGE